MRALIAAFLAAAALAYGLHTPAQPTPTTTASAQPTRPPHITRPLAYTILPLGDSITLGTGSTNGTGYRATLAQLAPCATFAGSQGTPPLLHEGHSGWRIDQLADIARATVAQYRPAYVLLHAGTNDTVQGYTASTMLAGVQRLLDEIEAGSPGTTTIVALIPITPYATTTQQAEEAAYDAGLPALVAGRRWVRLADLSEAEISADRVHPDDAGYAWMAQQWNAALPEVRAL